VLIVLIVNNPPAVVCMEFRGSTSGPLVCRRRDRRPLLCFAVKRWCAILLAGAFSCSIDAFAQGEYLDVGGVKGTIEKISVGHSALAPPLGALHNIPFGGCR